MLRRITRSPYRTNSSTVLTMDSIIEYGAQVKCRDCYTMIPVDPDTDHAPVLRRRCPECIRRAHRPRAQRRAAQRQSAGVTTTPTSASSLRTRLHSKSPPTTGTTPYCAASIGWRNDAEADAGTARHITKEIPY